MPILTSFDDTQKHYKLLHILQIYPVQEIKDTVTSIYVTEIF